VVLTVEVNKFLGGAIAGFVYSGDLLQRTTCASSDFGELFYGHVPDPTNAAGTQARSKSAVLNQMPSLIAHEFTHIIQQSRRQIELGSNQLLTSWEAEGQATLAEEVVGHSILGNQSAQNYGATVATTGQGQRWYLFIFQRLGWYYGWDGSAGRNADTPDDCTLFGNFALTTSCEPFWFYGASWAFLRHLTDRYGPTTVGGVGGEAEFQRNIIEANPTLKGAPNIDALIPTTFDDAFVKWAAMNYVDGRVTGASSDLLMTSWNVHEVVTAVNAMAPIVPESQTFSAFSSARAVRAGSTAYTLLGSLAAHPALAVRVHNGTGSDVGTALTPRLWVVRTK
jgi:hypothetical protein